ncbi:hypothetical protein N866_18765 [Actinotalea ferrariae CF5-4]|uniref:Uncharacterized protein n=1 Tax=Actinotalea ferrariae CF5-4 TaxID=948458 RepID=A0A021VRD9_9CELL|nr:hypothetical protein [Actinotalea ferrariae]EYR63701.1 hypothetical protein N866_18765 [Actinotalea ferrariae CF5-4]
METETIVWIVVAVLVLALIIGLALWWSRRSSGRRVDKQRQEAADLRRQAEAEKVDLQRREAEAQRLDAHARLAQAEADTRSAEAARLQAQARERSDELSGPREDVQERLRRADELDPDRPTAADRDHDGAARGTDGVRGEHDTRRGYDEDRSDRAPEPAHRNPDRRDDTGGGAAR